VATLLLPRLGTGNPIAFNNNFTVSKDGNPWSDGGGDTFDGTQGIEVSSANGWLRLGGNTYTTPDGSIDVSKALGADAVDLGIYSGWAIKGIWACEIELGHEPIEPLNLRFHCNTGYDGSHASGLVTRSFDLDGTTYELKTVWSTNSSQDGWSTTGETQLTVTVVPYLAEHNLPEANTYSYTRSGDWVTHTLTSVSRGATVYIQWGKVNISEVQDWIMADLVASQEFEQAPHERTVLVNSAPNAHYQTMLRDISPNSSRWIDAGGYAYRSKDTMPTPRNIYFGGKGVIEGTVSKKATSNTPLQRKVQLYSAQTNILVAETWSDETGNYRFDHLDTDQPFTVIAHDYQQHYRAVIADQLRPTAEAASL